MASALGWHEYREDAVADYRAGSPLRQDCLGLADRMPSFHWMTIHGDYMKELACALRRVSIQ